MASLVIVGGTSVAALAASGTSLRAAARAQHAIEREALTRELWLRVQHTSRLELLALPDSLARGRFAPPFEDHTWQLTSHADAASRGLVHLTLRVLGPDGVTETTSAIYRRVPREAAR
jgi:hypothetical protein